MAKPNLFTHFRCFKQFIYCIHLLSLSSSQTYLADGETHDLSMIKAKCVRIVFNDTVTTANIELKGPVGLYQYILFK